MPFRKAQFGCLTALLLFVLLGFFVEYFGKKGPPGDDEGGGPIAALGIVGLILFFVIFAVIDIVRAIIARRRREPRGFPVEPRQPERK